MLLYTLKSWDGHTLNDASYRGYGLNFNTPAAAKVDLMEMPGHDPVDVGAWSGSERSLAVYVEAVGASKRTLDQALKIWFARGESGYLVATNAIDGQDYQIFGRAQSMTPNASNPNGWTVIILTGQSNWRRVSAETDAWTANSGTLTKAITVDGALKTRLIAAVTPTAVPATGYRYRDLYILPAMPKIDYAARAWCITLNTAAMVSGGTLRADCNDLRIHVNGVEKRRYIYNPNAAATNVWFNAPMGRGLEMKLRTAVASSGAVGELQFAINNNTRDALKLLPGGSFILVQGTELFLCQAVDKQNYKVGVLTRGYLGTALASHAIGTSCYLVPAVVEVVHGFANATDPASEDANYDDEKPMFALSSSNSQWDYTAATGFYDPDRPLRGGQWTPLLKRAGDRSENYRFTQNGESGAPAMGMLMSTYQAKGAWKAETALLRWMLGCPGGFSAISATGSKRRSANQFPARAQIQRSENANLWKALGNESSPASEDTWTAFTINEIAINGTAQKYVGFALDGTISAGGAEVLAHYEILTCTVKFPAASIPTGTLLAQAASYPVAIVLKNNTNGQSVMINTPMLPNKVLLLDGENFEAKYDGGNAENLVTPNSETRETYIEVEPGANTLAIEAAEIGTLSIALSWYPRRP